MDPAIDRYVGGGLVHLCSWLDIRRLRVGRQLVYGWVGMYLTVHYESLVNTRDTSPNLRSADNSVGLLALSLHNRKMH